MRTKARSTGSLRVGGLVHSSGPPGSQVSSLHSDKEWTRCYFLSFFFSVEMFHSVGQLAQETIEADLESISLNCSK